MLLHERLLNELPERWRQLVARGASITIDAERLHVNLPEGVRFIGQPTDLLLTPYSGHHDRKEARAS